MIGTEVKDFRITGRLGKGGMGEVWAAEQKLVKTRVAIKMLLPEWSSNTKIVERFFNEAIAVARVKHSGIVRIYDVGFHDDRAYLIMELLEGETLTARLTRLVRLPIEQAADIARQITSVLAATHDAGITHRDLKPDNVFLVKDAEQVSGERAKILDFGIAKLGTLVRLTSASEMMGTPGYMAPEQWTDAANADARADVYSLGCLAFELFCGRPPFSMLNMNEAYAKHMFQVPPRVRTIAPEVPQAIDDAIEATLAKRPAERPSMKQLNGVFASIPWQVPPTLPPVKPDAAPPRQPLVAVPVHQPPIAEPGLAAVAETQPDQPMPVAMMGIDTPPQPRVETPPPRLAAASEPPAPRPAIADGGPPPQPHRSTVPPPRRASRVLIAGAAVVAAGAIAIVLAALRTAGPSIPDAGAGSAASASPGATVPHVEAPDPPPSPPPQPESLAAAIEHSNRFVHMAGLDVLQHQVTRGEYRRFLAHLDPARRLADTPRFDWDPTGDERPIAFTTFDQASAFCAAIQARLPTLVEWQQLAGNSWGIASDGPAGQSPGPLREWTRTLVNGLVRVAGGAANMSADDRALAMREPLFKSRRVPAQTTRELDPVSGEEIGFRCVR